MMNFQKLGNYAVPALAGAMCLLSSTSARAAITYNPGEDNNLYCSSAGGSISPAAPLPSGYSNGILATGYSSGSASAGGTCSGAAAPENVEAMKASLWVLKAGVATQCYAFANGAWIYNTYNFFGTYVSLLPNQPAPLGQLWVSYQNLCGAGTYTLYIETAIKNTTNGNTTWDYGSFQTPWTNMEISRRARRPP